MKNFDKIELTNRASFLLEKETYDLTNSDGTTEYIHVECVIKTSDPNIDCIVFKFEEDIMEEPILRVGFFSVFEGLYNVSDEIWSIALEMYEQSKQKTKMIEHILLNK